MSNRQVNVRTFIVQYPVLQLAQSAFTLLSDKLVQLNTISAYLGSTQARCK